MLIKLLADLKLFSADENLNKTESYLDILSILRNDIIDFNYLPLNANINVINVNNNKTVFTISRIELSEFAKKIFNEIKNGKGNAFSLSDELLNGLRELSINKLKEKSNSKGDINILVHDPSCGIKTQKKFSIKSFIGSSPTLFNANKTTNIIYEIKDSDGLPMPSDKIIQINSIETRFKYIDRIKSIIENEYHIYYSSFEDETFLLNLEIIDSKLPEIIAFAVLEKYVNRITKIIDVINNLTTKNPLGYNLTKGHNFYEYRIINFLVEAALGMTSAAVWNGIHDATGGIIIVKDDSEVVCYHLIEFNKFKSYLKRSARLDNPSGGRMDYGTIYEEDGKSFIKLNFIVKA